MTSPTVAEALAAGLARHRVTAVFGQSLPSALFLATPHHAIRQVTYRTENAGGATACSGRPGPVVLLLPRDVLNAPVPQGATTRRARLGTFPQDPTRPAAEPVAGAAELLRTARRPVVVAGGGVHLSGACTALGPALAKAVGSGRPYLVEVLCDPDAYPPITAWDEIGERAILGAGSAA